MMWLTGMAVIWAATLAFIGAKIAVETAGLYQPKRACAYVIGTAIIHSAVQVIWLIACLIALMVQV